MTNTEDLRRDNGAPDEWKIVEEFWPYDGPHGDWTTESAASVVAQLVRYLNNATWHEHAVPYAPTLYRVATSLSSAAFGLEQLAGQLAARAEQFALDESVYDDRGEAQSPVATAATAAAEFESVATAAVQLAEKLQRAAGAMSHLGHERS